MEGKKPKKFDSSALFSPYKDSFVESSLAVEERDTQIEKEIIQTKESKTEKDIVQGKVEDSPVQESMAGVAVEEKPLDISNDAFSKSRQNKIFLYFVLVSVGIFLFLRLPMSKIYYNTVSFSLILAPFIVTAVMAFVIHFKAKKYPDYRKVIRKFYLTLTLKILVILFLFYIFYAPEVFWNVIKPLLIYSKTVVSFEGAFYFLSYFLTIIIALATIFLFFRYYQKSKGTYAGSMQELVRKTLYALFFVVFIIFVSSVAAYPKAYQPILDLLGDTIYTVTFGKAQIFKGDDIASYKKISSIKDFTTSLSSSVSETAQQLSQNNQEFKTEIGSVQQELRDSLSKVTEEFATKLEDDLETATGSFQFAGGTITGDLLLEGALSVENVTYSKSIIPTGAGYDLGSSEYGFDSLYVSRIYGVGGLKIGDGSTTHGLSGSNDLIVSGSLEVDGVTYFDGGLDLGGSRLANLGDPVEDQDAVTKSFYDAENRKQFGWWYNDSVIMPVWGHLVPFELNMFGGNIKADAFIGDYLKAKSAAGNVQIQNADGEPMIHVDTGENTVSIGSATIPEHGATLLVNGGLQIVDEGEVLMTLRAGSQLGWGVGSLASLDSDFGSTYRTIAIGSDALNSAVQSRYNTAIGHAALSNLRRGHYNTAIGAYALSSDRGRYGGYGNTAIGYKAMELINIDRDGDDDYTDGNSAEQANVAIGNYALSTKVESGGGEIAIGHEAARYNVDNNYGNTIAIGYRSLYSEGGSADSNSGGNIAIGAEAMYKQDGSALNTAVGYRSMYRVGNSYVNVAAGAYSLGSFKDEDENGYDDLYGQTAEEMGEVALGGRNSAFGYMALYANASGINNSAFGAESLSRNLSGSYNSAFGDSSLRENVSGNFNSAFGFHALRENQIGGGNSAFGVAALRDLESGTHNVAVGYNALRDNENTGYNVGVGAYAMLNLEGVDDGRTNINTKNIAIGYHALSSVEMSEENVAIGYFAGKDNMNAGGGNVVIGYQAGMGNTGGAGYYDSVIIGTQAGQLLEDSTPDDGAGDLAVGNVLIGDGAANNLIVGSHDIIIGYQSAAFSDVIHGSRASTVHDALNIGNIIFGTNIDGWGGYISSGNIGIGTNTPEARFTIRKDNPVVTSGSEEILFTIMSDDNNVFSVDATGNYYADRGFITPAADYAEHFYSQDTDLKAGEAVCVDEQTEGAVKRCTNNGDSNIIGIVSTKPAIVGNRTDEVEENLENYPIVAMLGQIPAKITNENGDIQIGDSLSAASIGGYLRKSNPGESTVGTALQNFKNEKGTIQVLIARKNKSFTVETIEQATEQRIAEMNIDTQVDNLLSEAKTDLDSSIQTELSTLQDDILSSDDLNEKIENQMAELREQYQALYDFYIVFSPENSNLDQLAYKNAPVNVFDGIIEAESIETQKLTAQVIEGGRLIITNLPDESPTIGEGRICQRGEENEADYFAKGDSCAIPDDASNVSERSVKIQARIKDGSKVFVSLKTKSSTDLAFAYPLTVTKKSVSEDYFKVEVPELSDEQILELSEKIDLTVEEKEELLDLINGEIWFDWWVVESQ